MCWGGSMVSSGTERMSSREAEASNCMLLLAAAAGGRPWWSMRTRARSTRQAKSRQARRVPDTRKQRREHEETRRVTGWEVLERTGRKSQGRAAKLACLLACLLTCSLTHSLTHLLTYSLTHLLTYSLTH